MIITKQEISVLSTLNHPNIVKLISSFEGSRNSYLILEYVGKYCLYDYVNEKEEFKLSEEETKTIFRKVVAGIKYLHCNGICHRDLKLDNLIIGKNSEVKIIDFGFSLRSSPGQKVKLLCGTPSYIAPEMLKRIPYDASLADMWSLGVCIYRCISGRFPFIGNLLLTT